VPLIVDYPIVLATLERVGLHCVYPNSGAFGPQAGAENHVLGWIATEDPTIRRELLAMARIVPPPASRSFAALVQRAWQDHLKGPLWLMPASHWAYELQFGGAEWLPALLAEHGVDPGDLRPRSDGSAIEFQASEAGALSTLVEKLFDRLTASDFTIAFPGGAAVAMLHHHQQIWWQTSERAIWESLASLRW
jgi:hypothetical protein